MDQAQRYHYVYETSLKGVFLAVLGGGGVGVLVTALGYILMDIGQTSASSGLASVDIPTLVTHAGILPVLAASFFLLKVFLPITVPIWIISHQVGCRQLPFGVLAGVLTALLTDVGVEVFANNTRGDFGGAVVHAALGQARVFWEQLVFAVRYGAWGPVYYGVWETLPLLVGGAVGGYTAWHLAYRRVAYVINEDRFD